MKNIEFYKDELSGLLNPDMMYFFALDHGAKCVLKINPDTREGDIDMKSFVEWLLEEHQILDDVEKRYLKNIIRPFRDRVIGVKKVKSLIDEGSERIKIIIRYDDYILLPYFDKGDMYKGMKEDKRYTLEELGL